MAVDLKEVARAHLADAGVEELPDDWDVVTLGDLFTEDRGIAVGVMYPGDHDPDGVPLIKAGDLSGSIINPHPDFRIGKDKHHEYRRTALEGGELLMTLVGNVGQCAVVPPRMAGWNAARAVAVMRLAEPSDTHFVQQCLLSRPLQHLMDVWCNTTVQATLNLKEIRQLPLPWPPKKCRDAIAAFGTALDDKIELNRRMNATLGAMARALFQSWFVDFDPVRAKLDGREPVGLDQATADLFPETFEETAIGHVPNGWEVKTLGEVVELAYGKPLKAEDRKHGPVCVYGANGPVGWHDEKLVSGPGIVIGRKGNPGVVTWAHGDFYPIDTTFYVEPIGACRSLYFFYHALSLHNLANLSADSAVPGLNRNHAYLSMQVIPSQPVLSAFDSQISPIFAAMHANEEQARSLGLVRDTLLSKLLCGELTVPTWPSSE